MLPFVFHPRESFIRYFKVTIFWLLYQNETNLKNFPMIKIFFSCKKKIVVLYSNITRPIKDSIEMKWNQDTKRGKESFNLSNGLPSRRINPNVHRQECQLDIFRVYFPWNLYSPIIFTLNDLFRSNCIWKNGSETNEKSNGRREKNIFVWLFKSIHPSKAKWSYFFHIYPKL